MQLVTRITSASYFLLLFLYTYICLKQEIPIQNGKEIILNATKFDRRTKILKFIKAANEKHRLPRGLSFIMKNYDYNMNFIG